MTADYLDRLSSIPKWFLSEDVVTIATPIVILFIVMVILANLPEDND